MAKKLDSELDAIYSAGAADLAAMAPPAPAPAPAPAPERTPTAAAATQAAGGLPRSAGPTADDVVRRAKEMDVDPDFALALWSQESGRNSHTKDSPKGAVGGFQVMPDTYKGVMGSYAGQRDPWKNMEAGLKYIAYGQKTLNTRDPELLAAGYHAGYDRDDLKAGKIPDTNDGLIATRDYAKSIAARLGLNDPAKVEAKLNRDEPGRYKAITPEEAARIEAQQAADAEEPGRYKALTPEEAARLEQQAPAQAATDEPGTIGKGGAAGVMTGRTLPAPRNQSLAPVTPQFRRDVQRAYDAATPEQRAAMTGADGVVGQLAREMAGVQQDATRTATADLLDTTTEGRARRLARAGANAQTAERFARTGAERGTVPGTELGTIGQSDFDFEAQQRFNKDPVFSNPAIRAAVKGYEGYKQGALGLTQAVAELTGANEAAETAQRGIKASQGREAAMGEGGSMGQRNFEGAISSIAQQLPAMLGGVAAGGSAVPLAAMFTQSFGQEYGGGRSRGQTPEQAAQRAGLFATFEVLGEALGVRHSVAGLRKMMALESPDQIATAMGRALVADIPGELGTTTGQFLTDKLGGGIGLNREAGWKEYIQQMADTVVQTMMQGGLMMGATSGVSAAGRHLRGNQTAHTQELAAEQARENALAKAATFGGRNPNAPATPPAPPSGPIGRAVQKGAAPAPTAEVEGEDGQTYGITVGPDGLDVAALGGATEETQPVDSQGNLFAESGTESAAAQPEEAAPAPAAPTTAKPKAPETNDARYQEAVDFVRGGGAISPNAIMQKLRVGYTAADRMVRRMADEGVIAGDDLGNYSLAQGAAPAAEAAPTLTPAKPLAEMTEPELRERMQYIAQQKKLNGGSSKLFADERRKVEAEIEKRKAAAQAAPAPVAAPAEEQEPPAERTASGAYVKQSDANDAVRAAARSTGQPHQAVEREEDGRAVFDVKPLEEGNGPATDGRADSGRSGVAAAEPVPAPAPGPANQPGAAGAAAARQPGDAGRGEGAKAGGNPALSPDLAGAKPRYAYGNKQFTPTFENDIDRASFIASQTTPSKRDADYVKFVQDATGWTEDEVRAHGKKVRATIKGMAKDAEAGPLAVPAVHGAAPAAADAAADAEVQKVLERRRKTNSSGQGGEDADAIRAAAQAKQDAPAANPHAGKWFGTKDKADAYIAKKKADGYEATQTGKARWEITPKAEAAPAALETPTAHEKATAPEHVVGVDDRELGQIVAEFNAAQASMVEADEKVTHVFDAPAKGDIVRLQDKARVYHKDHGWMTPAEAKKVIQGWKAHAAAQGDDPTMRSENSQRVVLSLFDLSGEWSKPWEEAGYQVYRFDIQDDPTVGDVNNFSTEFFADWFGDFDGQDVYAILAACPCTDFASSGARHFAAKDADGRTVASVKLVHQTLAAIEYFKPPVWALENPVGRIEKLGGLPPWRLSFDPNHLGDPYTKKTLIWGRFNADLPTAPVEPTEGSKMHKLYGGKSLKTKNARSETPEGFSYGFFMANNAIDHPVLAVSGKYDRLDRDLIQQALDAGVTPDQIDSAVEDFYYQDLDDAAANDAIRDLIPEGGPSGGKPEDAPADLPRDRNGHVEQQPKLTGEDRWPDPIPMGKGQKATDLLAAQKQVVSYMNGDITRSQMLAALQDSPLLEGEIYSITQRLVDDAPSMGEVEAMLARREKGEPYPIANQSPDTTIEVQEGAENDGQATIDAADAGATRPGAEAVQPHEGSGDAERVPAQPAGGDAGSDSGRAAGRARSAGQRGKPRVRGESAGADAESEQRGEDGRGSGDSAGAGDHRGAVSRVGDNHRIEPADLTRTGSWRDTAERNVEIVELVKRLMAEGRRPTPEEAKLLTRFTGWGASEIANGIFPDQYGRYKNAGWQALGERLKAALTDEEYAQAKRTTQYAHYTSAGVIGGIYDALRRMGFAGGKIAEPGMGIGLFNGLMPAAMAANSQYTGIEYDTITGNIAKLLYPESNIIVGDYSKTALPRDFFDAAIGNPPFSQIVISNDPEYKKQGFMLHDYFFAKTIDRVRPGGMLVFVTSKGTMDKGSDRARKYLADRANLVGAIRLPQTAFKDNAGTEVVTDVLFLQKKGPGVEDNGVAWRDVTPIDVNGTKVAINEYFVAHPEMVLGQHATTGSMYRANEYTVEPRAGQDMDAAFGDAVALLPEGIYQPGAQAPAASRAVALERDFNPLHKKEGGLYVSPDGVLMQVDSGSGVPLTTRRGADGKAITLKASDKAFLTSWVTLRDALKQAQLDQLTDGAWEQSLAALASAYDAFTKKHGNLLAYTAIERELPDGTTSISKRFKNDPLLRLDVEGALAYSLEHIKESGEIVKAPVLSQRVLEKRREPEIKTTQDALFVSLNNLGRLDLDEVAKLAGMTRAETIDALGTAIYQAPGKGWQTADEYLSGNVRRKLDEAQAAARTDRAAYQRNVDALLAVQPKPLGPTEITVKLGQSWIPPSDVAQFATEVMGETVRVTYNPAVGAWTADQVGNNQSEYNFNRMRAGDILEAVLNNKQIRITNTVKSGGKTETVVDAGATEKANDIARKMREAFSRWVWTDTTRADRLVNYYNEHFNNIAPRKFDGSHLTLPGVSLRFDLYAHQKRAIWRMIQEGDTYLAHAVGAGKTFTMIAAGMEERRLGLANKPMYVVPNHMLAQFAREFLELYPAANIMVADEQNFHTHNRRRFVAQAALNNPDAIVITHSAFGRIGMSDAYTADFIKGQIDEWKDALATVDKSDRITRKQVERRIEALERRLESRQGASKDQVLTFEELGVDRLYVDEGHEFRKLDFATNQGNIKGIDPAGSQRAMDLFMKTRYLRSMKPGRALVMASGTPVTNTMGELYTVQRFFQPEQMAEDGQDTFDAWANQYGDVVAGFEQNAAGGYEVVSRFAKFQNVPELMRRVRSFMDILTNANLGELVQRPDVAGGGREVVVTPSPMGYKAYQASLEQRIKAIRDRKGPPKPGDDIILKVISDGRFSAIDMRFVDPTMPSDPNSKLNIFIDRLIAAYHEGKDFEYSTNGVVDPIKGSSIIGFTDIGLGEQSAASRGFDMKAWIEKRLIDAGIPAGHIAFMREHKQHAKKERLFADMRAGKRRILIGGKDMETGVNVQKRLTHLIHVDAPWFPSSVEQREGRIVRQGNQNRMVSVVALATKGSYDSTMWGMNGRKARFIEQAMNGDDSVRSLEDVSEASAFEMAAALASGDERYMRLAGLKADVDRLERLAQAHHSDQNSLRFKKNVAESTVRTATENLKALDKAMKKAVPIKAGEFAAKLGKTTYDSRDDFSKAVFEQFAGLTGAETTGTQTIGEIGGFRVQFHGTVLKGSGGYQASIEVDLPVDVAPLIQFPLDPDLAVGGIATRAANQVNNLDQWRREAQRDITESERRIEQIDKRLGAPFPEQQEMLEKMAALQALETELANEKGSDVSADAALATVATETGAAPAGLVEDAPNEPRQSVVGPEPVNGTAAKLLRETLTGGEFGPLVQSMLDAGKLVVHETPASVPTQTSRGVQAVTMPDGTIHMVARNLDLNRAAPTLLHEMFHAGVRPLLGETQWKNLMVRLHALQRQATQSTGRMRQFWDAAFERQRGAASVGDQRAMHPEEFGAYAIEEYEKAPVAVKRWVDDALGTIKAWVLRVFGMQVGKVTPPQLRALALAALKRAGKDGGTPDALDLTPAVSQSVAAPAAPQTSPAAPAPVAAGLTPPEPGRFERLQAAVQDNMNRVKKVQERIQKRSGLGDLALADYYRAETNRPGRIAARLEDAQRQLTGPLMARLAKEGFTPAQLEELLHAQHAQERNERIALINPDMPDGGSGMTTAEANKILAKVPMHSPLREIAQQARDIAAATLDLKQAYGLIDQETHDTLTKAYKHYVPLKGDGEFGPKIKRAMGHEERAEHILENIARDYDQAVVVGEKNLARQSLLALVAQHPDPDLWSIGVPPKGRYVAGQVYNVVDPSRPKGDQTIGSFNARSQVDAFIEGAGPAGKSYIVLDSNGDRVQQFNKPLQDNEVMVYVKGQPVRMQFHDEALARQVRPLDTRQLHPILEFMRGMNRYLSKIYTGYNPAFILRNAARDALTGTINMTGNEGAAVAARAWTRYPAALKAMTQWAATGRAPAGKTGQYVQEYRNNGGKTGASWMSDLEQQGKTLTRMYEDAYGAGRLAAHGHGVKAAKVAGRKIVGGMAHGIEVINQGTENALRLALYITLRERGETPARAAQAAKRVTVDFDRKGTTTGALGAIYLFMNPAIQGTANAMQTLVKGKHKYQAMAALGMLASLGFYAAAAGMDDDRDRWLGAGWDQRTKNFRLHLGAHTLNIPLSQEFAPAYAFGVGMAEAMRGESAMKSAVRMVSSFVDAYFPLNGFYNPDSNNHGLDAVLAATPTIIRPGAELAANRNVFGGQIVPENDRSKTQPDNNKMFRATKGTFFDALAQQIAAAGEKAGAGKFENDMSKVSPETLKYLWRTYTGGLGQFVTDSIGAGSLVAAGASMNSGDIPIAKDFWKPDDVKPIRGRYYDLANEARAAADEFKQARKAGDDEAAGKLLDRPGTAELVSLSRMFTQVGKAAAALRDEAAEINADPALTTAQKRDQLSALERQEESLYRTAIEVFNENVKK